MAELKPDAGKPVIKKGRKAFGIVTGIMHLKGDRTSGSIAISFSEAAILDIARRMLKEEFNSVDDMIKDLVGELANMMVGGGKALLYEDGYNFDLALPRVIAGEGHYIKHSVHGPVINIPFKTESGEFFVEVCFEE
jgi:chemotaxis protein CheX